MEALTVHSYPAAFRKRADALCERIGYTFENPLILYEALTHASFSNEHKGGGYPYNERIEFMGDSVLNFCVTREIYKKYPELDEGALTKLRAGIVCDNALSEYGNSLGLADCLLLGHGERHNTAIRRSIVADATEALFAAVFLDGGLACADRLILSLVGEKMNTLLATPTLRDAKSVLHELIQTDPLSKLEYVLVAEIGPDHDKRFETEVRLNSNPVGRGTGRSKRESEQAAAQEALRLFGVE